MKIFKPNTQVQQDQVFDRLADSFAALFFSIHPDTRDKIFAVSSRLRIGYVFSSYFAMAAAFSVHVLYSGWFLLSLCRCIVAKSFGCFYMSLHAATWQTQGDGIS